MLTRPHHCSKTLLRVWRLTSSRHDRTFLDRVATRIVELDRGLLRRIRNYSAMEVGAR